MLSLVVLMFLACHLLRMLETSHHLINLLMGEGPVSWHDPFFQILFLLSPFQNPLLLLNSSCNVLIYSWRDPVFRKTLSEMLWRRPSTQSPEH